MRYVETRAMPSLWSPGFLALLFCLVLSVVLVLFYFYIITPFVSLPADILLWAETNFVGDIIKLRIGAPIYTPPEDSNSLIYTPAAPLLTYAISWLIGKPTSISTWRAIQLGFLACAALISTASCRTMYRLAYPEHPMRLGWVWGLFTCCALFLAATSPRVNAYVHCLHTDALVLFVSAFSFWTMLHYLKSPSRGRLLLMAICPAVGYLTKQYLISWAALMFVFLFLRSPRNLTHLALFVGATVVLIAVAIGTCYLLWGDPFVFWTFTVMGGERSRIVLSPHSFSISLARGFEHMIRVWLELAIGVVGGWLILRGPNVRRLGPLWIAWVALVLSEVVSSGASWEVLYHYGPGVLIGAMWLCAALPRYWPWGQATPDYDLPYIGRYIKPMLAVAAVLTVFVTLRVVPTADITEARYVWGRYPFSDVYRYVADIEHEFEGLPPDKVLLDVGNWIYLRHSVLAKDRAISLADQPLNGIYDNFEVMVNRIRNKTYAKILVQDFHRPDFLYDYATWEKPSGVRQALLDNYVEVHLIPSPKSDTHLPPFIQHTGSVSVFVPKSE